MVDFRMLDTDAPAKLSSLLSPSNWEAKRLARAQMAEQQAGLQEASQLRDLLRTAGTTDPSALANQAYGRGLYKAGQEFEKQAAERRKATMEGRKSALDTAKSGQDFMRSGFASLVANPSDANVQSFLTQAEELGVLPAGAGGALLAQLPANPMERQKFLTGFARTPEQVAAAGQPKPQVVGGQILDIADPANIGKAVPQQMPWEYEIGPDGQPRIRPGVLSAKTQIAAAGANAGGIPMQIVPTADGIYTVPTRGGGPAQPITTPGGEPLRPPPRAGKGLSATEQKELFEADDMAQASANAVGMLEQALDLNKKAYSGIGAKPKAIALSNIPGMKTPEAADATIALDNLMAGQALESLKSTFGAAPTEGERKILMDLQASADKTPKQREDIIRRGIEAAKRRQSFNESKAQALREGTYSQAKPTPTAPAAKTAPAEKPKTGQEMDGYVFLGGNPADPSRWRKK